MEIAATTTSGAGSAADPCSVADAPTGCCGARGGDSNAGGGGRGSADADAWSAEPAGLAASGTEGGSAADPWSVGDTLAACCGGCGGDSNAGVGGCGGDSNAGVGGCGAADADAWSAEPAAPWSVADPPAGGCGGCGGDSGAGGGDARAAMEMALPAMPDGRGSAPSPSPVKSETGVAPLGTCGPSGAPSRSAKSSGTMGDLPVAFACRGGRRAIGTGGGFGLAGGRRRIRCASKSALVARGGAVDSPSVTAPGGASAVPSSGALLPMADDTMATVAIVTAPARIFCLEATVLSRTDFRPRVPRRTWCSAPPCRTVARYLVSRRG